MYVVCMWMHVWMCIYHRLSKELKFSWNGGVLRSNKVGVMIKKHVKLKLYKLYKLHALDKELRNTFVGG